MLWRLTRGETVRLLGRVRYWMLIAIITAACVGVIAAAARDPHGVVQYLSGGRLQYREYATSLLHDNLSALSLLCLVLPFVICDTFAVDRRSRYVSLLMARGASRATVVVSRALAGCLVCTLAVALMLTAMAVTALATTPHAHGEVGVVSSFLPELLDSAPVVYFLIVGGTLALTSSGVVAIGLLTSVFVRSWLVAVLTPPLVVLASQLVPFPEAMVSYSPGARATFLDYYSPWATPASTALYWFVVLVLTTLVATVVYRRKEDL